ncbi:MAG: Ig-like domain-containing protein [Fibrobacterota bacterium]
MKQILLLIPVVLLLASCAKKSFPGGGPGDVTPPRFESSRPASGTRRVALQQQVELSFSEWILPASADQGITLSPTLDSGFTVDVRRRNVYITPQNPLKENTTYHISLNSGLTDHSGNSLESAQTILLSTGDSISSGTLSGHIAALSSRRNSVKTGLLFAPVDPGHTRFEDPFDYLTESDSAGRFAFQGIRDTIYHCVAFDDRNSNNRLDPGETAWIPAEQPLSIGSMDTVQLFEVNTDTAALTPEKATPVDSMAMILHLSRPLQKEDSLRIAPLEPMEDDLSDATCMETAPIGPDSSSLLILWDRPLSAGQYRLRMITSRRFIPATGSQQRQAELVFNVSGHGDTARYRIENVTSFTERAHPEISLTWSEPVLHRAADTIILFDTDSTAYPFAPVDTGFTAKPRYRSKAPITTEKELTLFAEDLPFHPVRSPWHRDTARTDTARSDSVDKRDSIYTFTTRSSSSFALSFELLDSLGLRRGTIMQAIHLNGGPSYRMPVQGDTTRLEHPRAGNYLLKFYREQNGIPGLNPGDLYRAVPGDYLLPRVDTVEISPRWANEYLYQPLPETRAPAPKENPQ